MAVVGDKYSSISGKFVFVFSEEEKNLLIFGHFPKMVGEANMNFDTWAIKKVGGKTTCCFGCNRYTLY